MQDDNTRESNPVLVTGGSGYLGGHCIRQLLEKGHEVRATVRNPERGEAVRDALRKTGTPHLDRLRFAAADLGADAGWADAMRGCRGVLHVASPFPLRMPKDPQELIRPAVDGTRRVLRAAHDEGVRRVVLTSSFAAVGYGTDDPEKVITEADWTDGHDTSLSAYTRSKALAEREAWAVVEAQGGPELVTICPRYILGPAIGDRLTTSLRAVQGLLDGSMRGTPNVSYGIVDVRDVAALHLMALDSPAAAGERFLATTDEPWTLARMATYLKAHGGPAAARATTRVLPDWLVRLAALVNPAARGVAPNLGKTFRSDNTKATRLLGWKPRPKEETLLDTLAYLQEAGHL